MCGYRLDAIGTGSVQLWPHVNAAAINLDLLPSAFKNCAPYD